MAMKKKKTAANGSDRGAKMKANEAEKKKLQKASGSKYKPGTPNYMYDNMSTPQKKALGYGGKSDLAGINSNLKSSNPRVQTRTDKRATDQAKRAGVKAAKNAKRK